MNTYHFHFAVVMIDFFSIYVFFLVFAGIILYNDTTKVMTGRVAFIQDEEREWLV